MSVGYKGATVGGGVNFKLRERIDGPSLGGLPTLMLLASGILPRSEAGSFLFPGTVLGPGWGVCVTPAG